MKFGILSHRRVDVFGTYTVFFVWLCPQFSEFHALEHMFIQDWQHMSSAVINH